MRGSHWHQCDSLLFLGKMEGREKGMAEEEMVGWHHRRKGRGASGKEPTCQCKTHKRSEFNSWIRKIPWRSVWQPTPLFSPGESHGQRRLVGYSPQGCRVSYS
ncbi:hypothetical protein R6Z07F_014775 [Ovis aries]